MRSELASRAVPGVAAMGGALVVRALVVSGWPPARRALEATRPPLARAALLLWEPSLARRLDSPRRPLAHATLVDPPGGTVLDERGAARSVQAADLALATEALEALWSPELPERLGAAYWQHIERLFAGLLRVRTGPGGVAIRPLGVRPLTLMRFGAPARETGTLVAVRWPIAGGLLVARAGGSLEIAAHSRDSGTDRAILRVEVAIEGFRPTVARLAPGWLYLATQARVHVWVTHGYLRGLERPHWLARAHPGRRAGRPGVDGGTA